LTHHTQKQRQRQRQRQRCTTSTPACSPTHARPPHLQGADALHGRLLGRRAAGDHQSGGVAPETVCQQHRELGLPVVGLHHCSPVLVAATPKPCPQRTSQQWAHSSPGSHRGRKTPSISHQHDGWQWPTTHASRQPNGFPPTRCTHSTQRQTGTPNSRGCVCWPGFFFLDGFFLQGEVQDVRGEENWWTQKEVGVWGGVGATHAHHHHTAGVLPVGCVGGGVGALGDNK
jgi:hypothetical protein